MMKQLTVPYQEIENRLAICCEFLLDRQKSSEEAYESLMEKLGTKLMEYSEFEYWFKRFQNNQFDLGHDKSQDEDSLFGIPSGAQIVNETRSKTSNVANEVKIDLEDDTSQDSKEISEIQNTIYSESNVFEDNSASVTKTKDQVDDVERNKQDLKSYDQFNERNVPEAFLTFINKRSKKAKKSRRSKIENDQKKIGLYFNEQSYMLKLKGIKICLEKRGNDWIICYGSTVIKTVDPEKSIVDHLWFMLRNPKIELSCFEFFDDKNPKLKRNKQKKKLELNNRNSQEIDSDKMNTLLQAMFNTFNHQIQTTTARCDGFNEDTCLSMLKHVKPGTLKDIIFDISWKEEGNYQKMKEIVETDQWKQAKTIESRGVTTLKIDDLFQYERFSLQLDRITPEDVLRVIEHVFNSIGRKHCTLSSRNESLDIDTIKNVLRSQNDGLEFTEIYSYLDYFQFKIVKSTKSIVLNGSKHCIDIQNY